MKEQDTREKLFRQFLRGVNRTQRILWGDVGVLLELDITEAQRDALFVIAENEDMTITEIARRLGVTNGAVTQLVDSLVRLGIVERNRGIDDARKVCVSVTEFGMGKLRLLGQAYVEKFEKVFKHASNDQIKTLLELQHMVLNYNDGKQPD